MSYESAKKYLEDLELCKQAMYCPTSYQARRMLDVTALQFAKLLDVSIRTVWRWEESSCYEPSTVQKIAIKEILRLAEEKGFIQKPDD